MELRLLLALAAVMAPVLGSPIAAHNAPSDEILPFNPGGPMESVTDPGISVNPGSPIIHATGTPKPTPKMVNPGGPMIPAPPPNSVPSPMSVNPGGPIIAAPMPISMSVNSGGPVKDNPLSFNPGGPRILASSTTSEPAPMTVNPGGPIKDSPLSFNPGGPRILASSTTSELAPMTVNPGGPRILASPPTSEPTPMTVNPGGPIQTPGKKDPPAVSPNTRATKVSPQPSSQSQSPGFLPPPPPPGPFPFPPPKFITSYTIPPGRFIPSCKRMHHKSPMYTPLDLVQARATKQQLRDLVHGASVATTTPAIRPHMPTKASQGCTTTISQTVATPCEWHGTATIYPSTTTKYQGVDCHGCSDVYIHHDFWACPIQIVNATQTVATPSTLWSTTCRPSTTLSPVIRTRPLGAQDPAITTPPSYEPFTTGLGPREEPANLPSPLPDFDYDDLPGGCECPTTLFVQAPQTAGGTSTGYSKYTTTTKQIDCDGCPLVVMTVLQGFGPIAHFTKTTTLALGTATAYVCSAS